MYDINIIIHKNKTWKIVITIAEICFITQKFNDEFTYTSYTAKSNEHFHDINIISQRGFVECRY